MHFIPQSLILSHNLLWDPLNYDNFASHTNCNMSMVVGMGRNNFFFLGGGGGLGFRTREK